MTEYRIRGEIDITLSPSDGPYFEAHHVLGTYDNIPTVGELEQAGFTVEAITPPPPDEIGTIREFRSSGNRIILTSAGWHYLYPVNGGGVPDENGKFESFSSGWIERTRVVQP